MLRPLLVLLLLLIPGCVEAPALPEPTKFEYVCEQIANIYPSTSCEGLEEPTVIKTELIGFFGLAGAYVGGETFIFVNPSYPEYERVILHEMAHYVMFNVTTLRDRCLSEEVARFVDGDENEDWRIQYRCPVKDY